MSNSIDFIDELETSSDSQDNHSNVNALLPLDDDKLVETDDNGEEIANEDEQEVTENTDPAKITTKHNFVTSPWTKLGIVGGFFALGFGVVFLTLNSLISGGGQVAKLETEPAPTLPPSNEKNDGEVYAKLALQKQQNDLKNLNTQKEVIQSDKLIAEEKKEDLPRKKVETNTTPKKNSTSAKSYKPVRATQTPPKRTATKTVNRTQPSKRPSPRPQRPTVARIPSPRPASVKIPKVTLPSNNSPSFDTTNADPIKDIERLRSLSSFGRVDYGKEINSSIVASNPRHENDITTNNIAQTFEPNEVSPEVLEARRRRGDYEEELPSEIEDSEENNQIYEDNDDEIQQLTPKWEPAIVSNKNVQKLTPKWEPAAISKADKLRKALSKSNSLKLVSAQYLSDEESQILQERTTQYLVVGSTTPARLITPLIIAENKPNKNLRFTAQLSESIKSNTGEVAIPANTQVVIMVNGIDAGGGMDAEVVGIIKDGTEYPIAPGTISVLGKGGNPLMARRYKGRSSKLAGYDITLGTVAGLAKIGEVINQRDETIEDLPLGGTRRRTSGGRRNIPGAFIEGAFSSLSTDIRDRTRKATSEIMSRPKVWYIKNNSQITLRVNRSIKL